MLIIPRKWRNEWSTEHIKVLVLGSLSIQIGLIFLAPLRQRLPGVLLLLTLWVFYITSDFVATLALGNILGKQIDNSGSGIPSDLTALWAPCLLIHLGGPDPITSYSVEDNELWLRHLMGLIVQVFTAGFVFLQSLPNHRLWVPTLFVFISGLLKYGERTLALRRASMDNFKDKIISEQYSEQYSWREYLSQFSEQYSRRGDPQDLSSESSFILEGYYWFGVFKRLMVDMTFSSETLISSQDRFSEVSPKAAFKLVAIELSFLYDILYTKAVIIHSIPGRVVRCCSLISIVAAFIVFHDLDKTKFKPTDITVTYILLAAGLSLEVVAAVVLVISDWTIVSLSKSQGFMYVALRNYIVSIVNRIFIKGRPRWSNTIGHYNLVSFCLWDRDTRIRRIMSVKAKHKLDNIREQRLIPLGDWMEEMMFNEAKRRARNVDCYKILLDARSHRGRKALERHNQLEKLEWSMKKDFDECIILWHVATDICYYQEFTFNQSNREYTEHDDMDTLRTVSWQTSNYMLYLLILYPSMTQFGYGKTRFEATCAVVKKKFKGKGKLDHKKACEELMKRNNRDPGVLEQNEMGIYDGEPEVLEQNEMGIYDGEPEVLEQNEMGRCRGNKMGRCLSRMKLVLKDKWISWGKRKGEENKRKREGEENKRKREHEMGELILKDSLRLANELQNLRPEIKWRLISETWMEMLGYAAIHCNSYEHAKSLSRGGELLTHFWLLMAQMGVVDEHKIQQYEHKIQPSHPDS